MLSRRLTRYLLNRPSLLPPTFLLPWAARLSTASATPLASGPPPSPPPPPSRLLEASKSSLEKRQQNLSLQTSVPATVSASTGISSSVRELLPVLRAQSPHYVTVHIHGFPYLLTEGDTLRLPYLMPGVEAGDVLRLNRAINLGSRDYTLKAPPAAPRVRSPTTSTTMVLDPTNGHLASTSRVMDVATSHSSSEAPHFIPHIAKGKHAYIDDRLFECRAVVMGTESEPMRTKEKKKRRQRHLKTVKSKHRFTILKIKELRIKSLEELDNTA